MIFFGIFELMDNLFESATKSTTGSSRRRAQAKPNPATYVTPRQSDVNDFFRKRPPKVTYSVYIKFFRKFLKFQSDF